jgi:hypothetical protein
VNNFVPTYLTLKYKQIKEETMSRSALVSMLIATMFVLLVVAAACAPATPAAKPATTTPPAATTPATTTPAATTPAATKPLTDEELGFNAATYTNDEYKFSFRYPKEWASKPTDWEYQLFIAKAKAGLPSLTITAYPGTGLDKQKELLPTYYDKKGVTNLKWVSDKDFTLWDGTKCELVDWTYTWPGGLELESYAMAIDRGGKRLTFGVTAPQGMMDYEACKPMFNSLIFK